MRFKKSTKEARNQTRRLDFNLRKVQIYKNSKLKKYF